MASIPFSLRPLLGDDPAAVTAEMLDGLIGESEGQQVDWKREIGAGDEQRKDLARDVAAFANATGGLLVLGLEENAKGEADRFVGLPEDPRRPDLVHWVQSTVRARVSPPPPFSAHRIDHPCGEVVLVAVDPGDYAPYAQLDGSKLTFPVRSGAEKRYLSEPEVANWYARRLRSFEDQDRRLAELHGGAISERLLRGDCAWLVVTLLPSRPGNERLERDDVRRYREVLGSANLCALPGHPGDSWRLRVGHRALLAVDTDSPPLEAAKLIVDGSGTASIRWSGGPDGVVPSNLRVVAQQTAWLLSTLVAHAAARGASGTASVSIQVVARPTITTTMGDGYGSIRFGAVASSLVGPSPISTCTVGLDDLGSTPALLAAVHMLASELVSAYGHADLEVLTPSGAIHPIYFPNAAKWAAPRGVGTCQ